MKTKRTDKHMKPKKGLDREISAYRLYSVYRRYRVTQKNYATSLITQIF